MKALVLSKKVPYPPLDGECLVIQQDIEMLRTLGYHIDLLSLNTDKHHIDSIRSQMHTPVYVDLHSIEINTAIRIKPLVLNFLSSIPYNIERFYSDGMKNKLEALLRVNKYNIILFEGLHLHIYAHTIREHSDAMLIMRSHNVESEIWKRKSALETNLIKKWYLQWLSKKILAFEKKSFDVYHRFIAISDRDLEIYQQLGMKTASFVLPYTVKSSIAQRANTEQHCSSIFFIGSFDWLPNYEGIRWFIEKVWAKVHAEFPEWRFFIAGRKMNMADPIFQKAGIVALGEVPNTTYFMQDHPIMVVPLFFGSGIRIKIIEALFQGKIIVSTAIGAEGVYEKTESPIYLANDEKEFSAALKTIFESKQDFGVLSKKSMDFALTHFDFNEFSKKMKAFLAHH